MSASGVARPRVKHVPNKCTIFKVCVNLQARSLAPAMLHLSPHSSNPALSAPCLDLSIPSWAGPGESRLLSIKGFQLCLWDHSISLGSQGPKCARHAPFTSFPLSATVEVAPRGRTFYAIWRCSCASTIGILSGLPQLSSCSCPCQTAGKPKLPSLNSLKGFLTSCLADHDNLLSPSWTLLLWRWQGKGANLLLSAKLRQDSQLFSLDWEPKQRPSRPSSPSSAVDSLRGLGQGVTRDSLRLHACTMYSTWHNKTPALWEESTLQALFLIHQERSKTGWESDIWGKISLLLYQRGGKLIYV